MNKQVFQTNQEPHLELIIHGDLRIKGSEEAELIVKAEPESLEIVQLENDFTITCHTDCDLRTPMGSSLLLKTVHGNAVIKAVEGELQIDEVHGDLILRSVGQVTAGEVNGNVEAKNVMGSFTIKDVDGNLTLRDVQGQVTATTVAGNLHLDDVDDSIEASSEGNAVLRFDPTPGGKYAIQAGGNIMISLPEDASASIEIVEANRIILNMPDLAASAPVTAPHTLTLGEGDADIRLEAGGSLMLHSQGPRWDVSSELEGIHEIDHAALDIAEQVTRQIESQMAMLEQQLNSQLSTLPGILGSRGLSPEQMERIQQRAREAGERATERAQEKMRQAQERLARKLEAAQERAEARARIAEQRMRMSEERMARRERRGIRFPVPPVPPMPPVPPISPHPFAPPRPPSDPVTENERLTVLRMLSEKKISLAQAQRLLDALEGKEE